MKKNNLIRFVQSLVLLPIMTMSLPLNSIGSIHNTEIPQGVLAQKSNNEAAETRALNQAVDSEASEPSPKDKETDALQMKADAIDAYFTERHMPLAGTGKKMVVEAEKNGLDWRLVAAIAVRESTGGKNACDKVKHNPFGWGSCKIGFSSDDAAIETIAKNLGGNNPKTAHHYDNKTTIQILHAYNPPSIVPKYAEQVISIMNTIGDADMTQTLAIAKT